MPKVTEAYIEARRQEILDAAIACFTRKGFHQTTMDDICRQAELSPGAVYRYFASKEEIIEAAVKMSPRPGALRWIEEQMIRFDDFRETIETFNRIWYRQFEQEEGTERATKLLLRAWAEALQNPEVREDVLERWGTRLNVAEKMMRRAQELGQINPNLDPRAAACVMQALSEGFRLLWLIGPDFDIQQFQEVETALFTGTFWIDENGHSG